MRERFAFLDLVLDGFLPCRLVPAPENMIPDQFLRKAYARSQLIELRTPITNDWADFLLP